MSVIDIGTSGSVTPLVTLDLSALHDEISALLHESVTALFPAGSTLDVSAILSSLATLKSRAQSVSSTVTPPAPHPSSIKEMLTEEFQKLEGVIATWKQDFMKEEQAWTRWSEEALLPTLTGAQVTDLVQHAVAGIDALSAQLTALLSAHPGESLAVIQPVAPAPAPAPEEPVPTPAPEPAPAPEEPAH